MNILNQLDDDRIEFKTPFPGFVSGAVDGRWQSTYSLERMQRMDRGTAFSSLLVYRSAVMLLSWILIVILIFEFMTLWMMCLGRLLLSTCSSVDGMDKVSDGPKYQILSLAFHSNDRGPSQHRRRVSTYWERVCGGRVVDFNQNGSTDSSSCLDRMAGWAWASRAEQSYRTGDNWKRLINYWIMFLWVMILLCCIQCGSW